MRTTANPPYIHNLKNTLDEQTLKMFEKEILTEQERSTAADLYLEYNKNINDVENFLQSEFAMLQYKVTKCLRNRCFDDIFKDQQTTRICRVECTQGIREADKFVSGQFQQLRDGFQECLEKVNKGQWMIQGAFKCYHEMNEQFGGVKINIREEFNYYQ